jgi:hypothetical protein
MRGLSTVVVAVTMGLLVVCAPVAQAETDTHCTADGVCQVTAGFGRSHAQTSPASSVPSGPKPRAVVSPSPTATCEGTAPGCVDRFTLDPMVVARAKTVTAVAHQVVLALRLPDATPVFGPDPEGNEWKMLAVGFPVWLWTVGPDEVRSSLDAEGLSFTLVARRVSTTFSMGDGGVVVCGEVTPYSSAVKPGSLSPTCGYVYVAPSTPGPDFQVGATTHWEVSWSAAGESGVIEADYSGSRTLRIGEVAALVVK